jgi:hypothetical protein
MKERRRREEVRTTGPEEEKRSRSVDLCGRRCEARRRRRKEEWNAEATGPGAAAGDRLSTSGSN